VKNPDMQVLYAEAQTLIRKFEHAKIEHNLRDKNALADELANLAMDRRADVTEVGDGKAAASRLDEPSPVATVAGDAFACGRCGCSIEVRTATTIRPHQQKPFVCQCGAILSPERGRTRP
jgi:hypothetical protein